MSKSNSDVSQTSSLSQPFGVSRYSCPFKMDEVVTGTPIRGLFSVRVERDKRVILFPLGCPYPIPPPPLEGRSLDVPPVTTSFV